MLISTVKPSLFVNIHCEISHSVQSVDKFSQLKTFIIALRDSICSLQSADNLSCQLH